MNKKEKREQRHLKNKERDRVYKEEAWETGKLIEPNHNDTSYPAEYSREIVKRLRTRLEEYKAINSDNTYLIEKFRLYRQKIRDAIIYYNPDIEQTEDFLYIVNAFETYQDNPERLHDVL